MSLRGAETAVGSLAVLYIILFIVILVHELGHLCCALICGLRPISIRVGPFEFRPSKGWNTHFLWKTALTGAVGVRAKRSALTSVGRRYLSFIVAGTVTNILFVVLALPFAQRNTVIGTAAKLFVGCSIVMIIWNLLPSRHRDVRTDGSRLWDFLTSKRKKEQAILALTLTGQFGLDLPTSSPSET
jgi:hypothetical protein